MAFIRFNSKTPEHAWLSAMHLVDFVDEYGNTWHALECYYQAGKCSQHKEFLEIMAMTNPFDAKKRSKTVCVREEWESIKVLRMYKGMMFLLDQNKELANRLIGTGTDYLVHITPWKDLFWGWWDGEGSNIQGQLWMQHRQRLRAFRR